MTKREVDVIKFEWRLIFFNIQLPKLMTRTIPRSVIIITSIKMAVNWPSSILKPNELFLNDIISWFFLDGNNQSMLVYEMRFRWLNFVTCFPVKHFNVQPTLPPNVLMAFDETHFNRKWPNVENAAIRFKRLKFKNFRVYIFIKCISTLLCLAFKDCVTTSRHATVSMKWRSFVWTVRNILLCNHFDSDWGIFINQLSYPDIYNERNSSSLVSRHLINHMWLEASTPLLEFLRELEMASS